MKKAIAILFLCALTCLGMNAQTTIKWPNASMTSVASATLATKVTTMTPISVVNNATYVQLTTDTSLVLRASVNSTIRAGALLYVTVTNGATAASRVITGSTGITMASYTMTSAKAHLLTFVYDGTNFLNTGVIKIN
jgi:hypothetical protein